MPQTYRDSAAPDVQSVHATTEERRGEIVQGLLRAIAHNGYGKASIQSIAREAGLAPGLVHYHFKTKQDILLALVEWMAKAAMDRMLPLKALWLLQCWK